ncbi:MAG: tRNA methyl transferase PRC-barrel domain-containing protein, partial [Alsobacter sp.]
VLGRHAGVMHYTVGQRRGLGIASAQPLYVVSIDGHSSTVVVGPREALATHTVRLREVNWLGDGELDRLGPDGMDIAVRVRSTRAPQAATLRLVGGEAEIELAEGEYGVSPGQACVFYDSIDPRARVLGGGVIRPAAALRIETPARAAALSQG